MSKRFIDTEIFNDSWFMNLPPNSKLFFIYLITNCDQAGIIDLNNRLAEFQTGIEGLANSLETIYKEFGEKRIIHLSENYYFLPKFVKYQYPNGLSDNVKAQKSVIDKLIEFNIDPVTLTKQLGNSYQTVQDKDKDKDKDKETLKGGVGEKSADEYFDPEIDIELVREISNYFGFSEIRNPDKFRQIFMFLNILETDGQADHFREQFTAYISYKEQSHEARFSFPRFLGSIDERYQDGGWNSRNWVYELKNQDPERNQRSSENLQNYNKKIIENLKNHVG